MDLSSINKTDNASKISFSGHKTVKNEQGKNLLRVYPPHSLRLEEGEELGIELITMQEDKGKKSGEYGWKVTPGTVPIEIEPDDDFKKGKSTYFDIDLDEQWINDGEEVGYRFVVKNPKDETKEPRYYDSGIGSSVNWNGGSYTVASTATGFARGPMEHIFTDSYNALDKVRNRLNTMVPDAYDDEVFNKFRRNHLNRAGGNIRGIIDKIDNELSHNRLIMTTPLIGGGITSSHMYHPANHFHISSGMGTKQDFLDLQTKCFDSGMGYVLDGAFTSQGYEGLQFNHVLQYEDSPFKFWFKDPPEDGVYKLRTLPEKDKEHLGIRVVNPGGQNPDRPTYVQFYDTRLVTEDQLKDTQSLIKQYDKIAVDDPYEITTWNDGTLNNYFEIDPKDKNFNHLLYGSYQQWCRKGFLAGTNGNDTINPSNRRFSFVKMGDTSGYTGWDGNIDMVKMNLSNHDIDSPEKVEGNKQAKNYIYNVATYWTTQTRNALVSHIADELHSKDDEGKKAYFKELEGKYSLELEQGALDKTYQKISEAEDSDLSQYEYKMAKDDISSSEFIFEKILEVPMESLNFSGELLSVLSTPYITPRPSENGNPNGSKTEIYNDALTNTRHPLSSKMQKVYTETLPTMIKGIMSDVQTPDKPLLKQTGDGSSLTVGGQYFLELAKDDIMSFLVTESLFKGDNEPFDENGNLNYGAKKSDDDKKPVKDESYFTLNRLLRQIGKKETTAKGEADLIASRLEKGLSKLKTDKPEAYNKLIAYLKDKYYKPDVKDYKMAEAIVDRTKAGLNWRFDAAKDIGDWDEEKEGNATGEQVWDDVTNFWKPFVSNVRKVNPSSFVVAEVTSLHDLKAKNWGKYGDPNIAERNFYEITGATTGSNYSVYFSLYPTLFGQNVEEGKVENFRSIYNFINKTDSFLRPDGRGNVFQEFITASHVFLGNHDKPRPAHLMAVDSDLFWSDTQKIDGENKFLKLYGERAKKVLGLKKISDNSSSKAVAVAEKYLEYFEEAGKAQRIDDSQIEILQKAVRHLANGYNYKSTEAGKPNFERAVAFATVPYEITIPNVIEQAEAMGFKIMPESDNPMYKDPVANAKKKLAAAVHKKMVEPYMSKMGAIYEMMTATTGIPTLFAGDEFAQTGCETPTKNWMLGCRNLVRHDWFNESKDDTNPWFVDGENVKQYVVDFNKKLSATANLSKKEGMSPLVDGTPVGIPVDMNAVINNAPKDTLIEGFMGATNEFNNVKALGESIVDISTYQDSEIMGKAKDDIKAALQNMNEDDARKAISKSLEGVKSNTGLLDWAYKNILAKNPKCSQTGAVYKYDDKGNGVLTVFTNAYIPDDPTDIRGLKNKNEVSNVPQVSDIALKDSKGELAVEPGTKFARMVYNPDMKDYVQRGEFTVDKTGHLQGEGDFKDATLDSTVTYFKRLTPKTTFIYAFAPYVVNVPKN